MTVQTALPKMQAAATIPTEHIAAPLGRMAMLKQATGPAHQRLEQRLDLFKADFSVADYIMLLEAFWGYYFPLETQLMALDELKAVLPDWTDRAKLPGLIRDLQALTNRETEPESLPICQYLPPCDNLASALGCLYVLEGATLGGQVISRHLNKTFYLDATHGAAFFNGYGAKTAIRWRIFGEGLTAADIDEELLVEAACATFLTLEQWLVVQYLPKPSNNCYGLSPA